MDIAKAFGIVTLIVLFPLWMINVYQIVVGVPGDLKWINLFFIPVVMAQAAYNLGWFKF